MCPANSPALSFPQALSAAVKAISQGFECMPPSGSMIQTVRTPENIEVLLTPSPFQELEIDHIEDGFLLPKVSPDNKPVRYIIYYVLNQSYGYFDRWSTLEHEPKNIVGASVLCSNGDHLAKELIDGAQAKAYFLECKQYSIFELLKLPEGPQVSYVVVQGIAPGVYTKHKSLVHLGLGYQRGLVYYVIGDRSVADARALFACLTKAGKVVTWQVV
ncbi:hypothetical protein Moror_5101 [Moniliophthora roreri MCA 2997]|uniref:Uncharacterized protein n=1 Tax=Moniliophthora roreri (strain MCA 2997) TaxID=1381753 RepID=V2WLX5_MONRO|nr:hypothetical protein Moror_5101 [Moniliophthora roreri MCA 2997]